MEDHTYTSSLTNGFYYYFYLKKVKKKKKINIAFLLPLKDKKKARETKT